jgi:hypothetical protein
MANEYEDSLRIQFIDFIGLHITYSHLLYFPIPNDFFDYSVPYEAHLLVGKGAVLQCFPGAQFIAAVDNPHPGGKSGKEDALFESAVTTANYQNILVTEEETVTSRTERNTPPDKFLFPWDL